MRSRRRSTRWTARWTRDTQPLPSDRLFHLRIAEATGNGALVHVIKMLWDERTGRAVHAARAPLRFAGRCGRRAMNEHRAVLKSIAAHDPDAARAAMQRHLNQAYKRFSKGWNARTA